ncbi:S41 family peptidase [Yoonia sp. GPGPB17]|uniref:S41 family peptidase n=1 Tax=Yoonia sp. GPGPB17 TaxID=3026147 RepID=UPI0030BDB570
MRKMILLMCLCTMSGFAGANSQDQYEGVWVTDGYGWLLHIEDGNTQIYQYSGDICIKEHPEPAPLSALLPTARLELSDEGTALRVFAESTEPFAINARRIDALPTACDQTTIDTPEDNFLAFVTFFDEHYPFFDLYDVNWAETVAEVQPMIGPNTSDQELFELMTGMMEPIEDAHVSLWAEFDGAFHRFNGNRGRTSTQLRKAAEAAGLEPAQAAHEFRQSFWYEGVAQGILQDKGTMAGNEVVQYGMLEDGVGYLAIAGMSGFAEDGADHAALLVTTQVLFDRIIRFFNEQNAQSLILDVSFNLGGHDYVAREIASRFVTEPFMAYSKYAADASAREETQFVIAPSEGPRFEGDVFLITSNITVSAAEVFAITMRALPQVTHLGEPTRGAFSDILSRTLPNGWALNLSNEVYLDADNMHWEGHGISPHLAHVVFSDIAPMESHRQLIWGLVETLR